MRSSRSPSRSGGRSGRPSTGSNARWTALGAVLLVLGTVVAYLPALDAGYIWDDDQYVTENPTLRSTDGLVDIWTEPKATPQYYPLVHTSFWIEYQLWELDPFGYHLVNVLLHALGALFLWRALRRLGVPGAWVAAAIFAVHPVHVESVAWVTERKNVLSGVFFFASLLAFLRFRPLPASESGKGSKAGSTDGAEATSWAFYGLSLALFVGAVLSKTVAVTLAAVLVLLVWWKTGRLPRRHVLPTLPYFAVGVPLGLLTVYLERLHVGAVGEDWALSIVERFLIAGRVVWFYAGKLVWPHPLAFIYRRWEIADDVWWQYLFPLAALAVVAVLWHRRRTLGRGPLVAVLAFGGMLTPALGFFNVFPMRYSWVADHFQYLASTAFLALVVGVAARGAARLPGGRRTAAGVAGVVLVILGALTWNRSESFLDREVLWKDTLEKTPTAWIAHSNYGVVLMEQERYDEAVEHFERSLELNPEGPHAHHNLAEIFELRGELNRAIEHREKLVEINPKNTDALLAIARGHMVQGRLAEAETVLRRALEVDPELAPAYVGLAQIHHERGEYERAAARASRAVELDPDNLPGLLAAAAAHQTLGREDEAVTAYRRALPIAREQGRADLAEAIARRLRALGAR